MIITMTTLLAPILREIQGLNFPIASMCEQNKQHDNIRQSHDLSVLTSGIGIEFEHWGASSSNRSLQRQIWSLLVCVCEKWTLKLILEKGRDNWFGRSKISEKPIIDSFHKFHRPECAQLWLSCIFSRFGAFKQHNVGSEKQSSAIQFDRNP